VTEKRRRRTQGERSATTRENLLQAAIKCLFEHGYGATTTNMVAKEAGVTRGAMVHHFPSKADLMIFVVESVTEASMRQYRELLAGVDDPRERLLAYPEVACTIDRQPSGIAVLEILLGSRSDPQLAAKLAPVRQRMDEMGTAMLRQDLEREPSFFLTYLIIAVSRGLSVTEMLSPQSNHAAGVLRLFRQLLKAGVDTGVILTEMAPRS
jgi:AcrR family transcriptional regulator